MSFLSARQYAKARGVSHTAVNKAIAAGKIPLINGKIDPVQADAAWEENRDPRQSSKMADAARELTGQPVEEGAGERRTIGQPERGTFRYAQLQHEMAKAARTTLEVQKLQGKVIDTDVVKREIGDLISNAKRRLLAMGNALAPELASESDPAKCQAIIEAEVHDALTEISQWEPTVAAA